MEIFRQLQMRRQETGEVPGAPDASAATAASFPPASAAPANAAPRAVTAASSTKLSPRTPSKAAGNAAGIDPMRSGGGGGAGRGGGHSDDEGNAPFDADPAAMQVTSSDDSPGSARALLRLASGEPEPEPRRATPKPGGRLGAGPPPHRSKRTTVGPPRSPKSLAAGPEDGLLGSQFHAAEPDFSEPAIAVRKPGSEALPLPPSALLKADSLLLGGGGGGGGGGGHKHSLSDAVAPMERSDSARGSRRKALTDLTLAGMERSDSLRVSSGRKHFPDLCGVERSDSLRGGAPGRRHPAADAALSTMERSDSLRSAGRKPELPPKPTFAAVPAIDSRRSPKPLPLKMLPTERVLYRADTGQALCGQAAGGSPLWRGEGSGQLAESSSGSEQDGFFNAGGGTAAGGGGGGGCSGGRRSQGQGRRNLRKTKSRGKGKGAGTLTPTLLLDELSFTVHEPPRDLDAVQDVVIEACPPQAND